MASHSPWSGVGDLLASTGFSVTPELPHVPDLPQSERHCPLGCWRPWCSSTSNSYSPAATASSPRSPAHPHACPATTNTAPGTAAGRAPKPSAAAATRVGATLRSGRTEQTRVPLDWAPASAGSQRSLLPDVVLDAQYKQHDVDRALKERHRNDLMQALAYSTLFDAPKIVTLLVYPCGVDAYRRLAERGRAHSLARVRTTPRNLYAGLMAVPLGGDVRVPVAGLEGMVRGMR